MLSQLFRYTFESFTFVFAKQDTDYKSAPAWGSSQISMLYTPVVNLPDNYCAG